MRQKPEPLKFLLRLLALVNCIHLQGKFTVRPMDEERFTHLSALAVPPFIPSTKTRWGRSRFRMNQTEPFRSQPGGPHQERRSVNRSGR